MFCTYIVIVRLKSILMLFQMRVQISGKDFVCRMKSSLKSVRKLIRHTNKCWEFPHVSFVNVSSKTNLNEGRIWRFSHDTADWRTPKNWRSGVLWSPDRSSGSLDGKWAGTATQSWKEIRTRGRRIGEGNTRRGWSHWEISLRKNHWAVCPQQQKHRCILPRAWYATATSQPSGRPTWSLMLALSLAHYTCIHT